MIEVEITVDRAIAPGYYLERELEARAMTQRELAQRMRRPPQAINEIIKGKKELTQETALELERVLGTPARVWVNLESAYRLARAREAEREDLERQKEWVSRFPVREMEKRRWIPESKVPAERVRALLSFFGVASFDDWTDQQEVLGFRVSPRAKVDHHVLHAWVRRGEIEGREVDTGEFNRENFRKALLLIRGLTSEPASAFWPQVQELCAGAGVAVVAVREFPKTGATGVARWLSPTKALIQLNLRGRWADIFWYSFYHEAAHVLMHKQKRIFVDFGNDDDSPDEHAANQFASDALIAPDDWATFVAAAETDGMSVESVRDFSKRCGISMGIVVGRLQHEKVILHSQLNALRPKLMWVSSE